MRLDVFVLAAQFPGRSQGDVLAAARDAAVAAERAGLDGVWIAEHHFIPYGLCPSAVAFAANVLGLTSRVDVGTAISILSAQHPVALAEQAALLDHLSGGRFRLGVGRGGPWLELEVLGTGLARYEHGFAESLDLLLRCLTGEPVSADGEHFRFREVTLVPRPLTRPRPPVVVAATSMPTVELAAARGLPLLLGMDVGDADKRAMLDRWASVARRHGHDPDAAAHAAAALAYVADSRAEALATVGAALPGWLARGIGAYTTVDGRPRRRRDPRAYTEHLCAIHPVGTPEDCAERLARTAEATGVRRFLLMVEGAGDRARTLENVARLGAEVAPLLRGRAPVAPAPSPSSRVARRDARR